MRKAHRCPPSAALLRHATTYLLTLARLTGLTANWFVVEERTSLHPLPFAALLKATITLAQLAGLALFMGGVGVGLPAALFAAMGR